MFSSALVQGNAPSEPNSSNALTRTPLSMYVLIYFSYLLLIFYLFFAILLLFNSNVLYYLRTPQEYFARQLQIVVRLCKENITPAKRDRLIRRYRRRSVNKRAAIQIYSFIFQFFQKITGFRMKFEPVPDEEEVTVVAMLFDAEQDYFLEISCDMRNVGNNVWRSVDAFLEI